LYHVTLGPRAGVQGRWRLAAARALQQRLQRAMPRTMLSMPLRPGRGRRAASPASTQSAWDLMCNVLDLNQKRRPSLYSSCDSAQSTASLSPSSSSGNLGPGSVSASSAGCGSASTSAIASVAAGPAATCESSPVAAAAAAALNSRTCGASSISVLDECCGPLFCESWSPSSLQACGVAPYAAMNVSGLSTHAPPASSSAQLWPPPQAHAEMNSGCYVDAWGSWASQPMPNDLSIESQIAGCRADVSAHGISDFHAVEASGLPCPSEIALGEVTECSTLLPSSRRLELPSQCFPENPMELDQDLHAIMDWESGARVLPICSALSPLVMSEAGCIGSVLKNTFMHVAPPPASVIEELGGSSQRRSRSVPKDMGSSKAIWDTARDAFASSPTKGAQSSSGHNRTAAEPGVQERAVAPSPASLGSGTASTPPSGLEAVVEGSNESGTPESLAFPPRTDTSETTQSTVIALESTDFATSSQSRLAALAAGNGQGGKAEDEGHTRVACEVSASAAGESWTCSTKRGRRSRRRSDARRAAGTRETSTKESTCEAWDDSAAWEESPAWEDSGDWESGAWDWQKNSQQWHSKGQWRRASSEKGQLNWHHRGRRNSSYKHCHV